MMLNANSSYLKALSEVYYNGHGRAHDRNDEQLGGTLRLFNHQVRFDSALPIVMNVQRKVNYRFMVRDALHILKGRSDVLYLEEILPSIAQYSDDGSSFEGAYGPYWAEQYKYLRYLLSRDPDTRRAVLTIGEPAFHYPNDCKDIPCTRSIAFYTTRPNPNSNYILHASVFMRGNDVYWGLVYNMFNNAMMLRVLAEDLGMDAGSVCITAADRHLYDKHKEAASQVILKDYPNHKYGQRWNCYDSTMKMLEYFDANPGEMVETYETA